MKTMTHIDEESEINNLDHTDKSRKLRFHHVHQLHTQDWDLQKKCIKKRKNDESPTLISQLQNTEFLQK